MQTIRINFKLISNLPSIVLKKRFWELNFPVIKMIIFISKKASVIVIRKVLENFLKKRSSETEIKMKTVDSKSIGRKFCLEFPPKYKLIMSVVKK